MLVAFRMWHCAANPVCGFNSWIQLPHLSDEVKMEKTPMCLLGAFQEFQVVKINSKLPTKAF